MPLPRGSKHIRHLTSSGKCDADPCDLQQGTPCTWKTIYRVILTLSVYAAGLSGSACIGGHTRGRASSRCRLITPPQVTLPARSSGRWTGGEASLRTIPVGQKRGTKDSKNWISDSIMASVCAVHLRTDCLCESLNMVGRQASLDAVNLAFSPCLQQGCRCHYIC